MNWELDFTEDARTDFKQFNNFEKHQIDKAIDKVLKNPLPQSEGGYGKPLGNRHGNNLTGLLKIKLLKLGVRVVYELIRTEKTMKVIVISMRADNEVYNIAAKRIK